MPLPNKLTFSQKPNILEQNVKLYETQEAKKVANLPLITLLALIFLVGIIAGIFVYIYYTR